MFVLNPHQAAAVQHDGGPLLVLAGAGTGKTGTLAHRVARLLRSGADPSRLCLLTFSRRAAQEMLGRAARLASADGSATGAASRVWGGTFHAVANRVLRLHGRRLGIDPGFSILDQGDAVELFGFVRHDLGLSHVRGGRRFPQPATLAAVYDRVVNTGERLPAVIDRSFPWCAKEADGIRAVFQGYVARKREHQLLDYDDLLLCWRALDAVPGLLTGLFDHVLVDEYQDTNALQADILAALRPDGTGLTVVGDDAQAIYGFRAASSGNILAFPDRFPGTTVVRLEQNYRSTTPILAVANRVMAEAAPGTRLGEMELGRMELWSKVAGTRRPLLRTCADETAEAEAVCDSVLAHRDDGVALRDQAVLFRASHHADLLELQLVRRNIPYVKYGGLKFLEAAHVKDLMALLRVLDNPCDELAWFRILQLLEGVGAATARRCMTSIGLGPQKAGGGAVDPALTPLARFLAAPVTVPAAARPELSPLRSALAECADGCLPGGATPPAGVQVERLLRWLVPVIERVYAAPAPRIDDLRRLEQVAAGAASRSRFVGDLTLDPPRSTSDLAGPPLLDEDWLVLSTVHSAKGGEWDVVHLLHASDGMFPSDMATGDAESIEEERRLLYVAVTRARHALEVNAPLRYHHHGPNRLADAHSYAQVSRFLSKAVQAHMDLAHAGASQDDGRGFHDDVAVGASGPALGLASVDSLLAGLWS